MRSKTEAAIDFFSAVYAHTCADEHETEKTISQRVRSDSAKALRIITELDTCFYMQIKEAGARAPNPNLSLYPNLSTFTPNPPRDVQTIRAEQEKMKLYAGAMREMIAMHAEALGVDFTPYQGPGPEAQ